jgi:hypothetical protein
MKKKLETPTSRLTKLVSRRLNALLEAIGRCAEASDNSGLLSDLSAFGPVLELLRDTVDGRVPLDRPALAEWTSALAVLETEDEADYEIAGGWEDEPV